MNQNQFGNQFGNQPSELVHYQNNDVMLVGNLPSFNSKINANNDVYRNYDTMS